MKKAKKYTGKAYLVVRSEGVSLSESIELTIKDGIVVEEKTISRAPNLPAIIISQLNEKLWSQFRDATADKA